MASEMEIVYRDGKLFKLYCGKPTTDEVADNEEEDEEPDPPPPPSLCEAMTVLVRYFEWNKNTTVDEMDKLMNIEKLLKEKAMKNLCQRNITGGF